MKAHVIIFCFQEMPQAHMQHSSSHSNAALFPRLVLGRSTHTSTACVETCTASGVHRVAQQLAPERGWHFPRTPAGHGMGMTRVTLSGNPNNVSTLPSILRTLDRFGCFLSTVASAFPVYQPTPKPSGEYGRLLWESQLGRNAGRTFDVAIDLSKAYPKFSSNFFNEQELIIFIRDL